MLEYEYGLMLGYKGRSVGGGMVGGAYASVVVVGGGCSKRNEGWEGPVHRARLSSHVKF